MLAFVAFEDTFRRERSSVYRAAVARRRREAEAKRRKEARKGTHMESIEKVIDEKMNASEKTEPLPSSPSTRAPSPVPAPQTSPSTDPIRLSLRDVAPLRPMILVLRRFNNAAILTSSGLIYAFSYCISYTCSRTLDAKYGFDALKIGLVLLSYGVGKS